MGVRFMRARPTRVDASSGALCLPAPLSARLLHLTLKVRPRVTRSLPTHSPKVCSGQERQVNICMWSNSPRSSEERHGLSCGWYRHIGDICVVVLFSFLQYVYTSTFIVVDYTNDGVP